jgi:hypothetical protein
MASFQLEGYIWLATDPKRLLAHHSYRSTLADKVLGFMCKLLTWHLRYATRDTVAIAICARILAVAIAVLNSSHAICSVHLLLHSYYKASLALYIARTVPCHGPVVLSEVPKLY